jgi:phosphatidylinositol-bisphosphatase
MFDPLSANRQMSPAEWPLSEIMQPLVDGVCPIVSDSLLQAPSNTLRMAELKKNRSLQDLSSTDLADGDGNSASPGNRWNSLKRTPGGATEPFVIVPNTPLSNSREHSRERNVSGAHELGVPSTGGRELIAGLLMKERQHEYTQLQTLRVYCGTWNVNGQSAQCDLNPWLSPINETPPDIYAIGFQELDLSKNAYIFSGSSREDEWYSKVSEALCHGVSYVKVKLVRLVGIMLVIFVREPLKRHVRNCLVQSVGTGLLGMMGNKGGVAIRLQLHDTSICFVCSHLAAHTEDVEGRNQDFRDITSRLQFELQQDSLVSISEHDVIFWLGDLNYRISDIDSEECKKLITKGQLADLLKNNDQLVNQIANKRAFLDYQEGQITFNPTYKYDPGTDNWDSSDKCRTPAWCDRILWRGENIRQVIYRSHPFFRLSDHKPVSATFDLGVKVINKDLEKKVREDVMKILDQKENEYLPQVVLDTTEVHFKNVKFIELQRQSITLTNTGQVPVQFAFINKLCDKHYCKPWLNVEPSHGFIHINDKATVQLEVYVDKTTAPLLNTGKDQIDDILVLHLQGGKDLFVTVTGNYLPSCFGSAIEDLIRMYGPVRERRSVNTAPLDIPKELWRLVDFIYHFGIDEDELFQLPGLHSEITLIRECLDTGTASVLPGSVHSVAEALLTLLESFAEPVIPYKFYTRCLEACANFTLCKQILSNIPVSHRNVFKYVCAFLRKLLQHSVNNKLDAKFLATVFGSLMLRAAPPGETDQTSATAVSATKAREDSRRRAGFVYNFLVNEYDE